HETLQSPLYKVSEDLLLHKWMPLYLIHVLMLRYRLVDTFLVSVLDQSDYRRYFVFDNSALHRYEQLDLLSLNELSLLFQTILWRWLLLLLFFPRLLSPL